MARMTRLGLAVVLAGCAAVSPKPASVPATANESAGMQESTEAAVEPAGQEPSEPVAGPAKLIVATEIGHTMVAAHITVRGEDGRVLAEGNSGEVLAVQSGELEVEATVTDAQAFIDLPTMRQRVIVEPGTETKERLEFARCLVRVTVNIRGKLDPKAIVTLSRDGTPVAKLTSGAEEFVAISPGRYGASVKSDRALITVSEIALNEGATQSIPISMN